MYSVYKHTTPSGKVYIGVTSRSPDVRWRNGRGYVDNEYFSRAIQKYGWENIDHEILYVGLTKEEAEQKEIKLISRYMSNQRAFGYNIENGGTLSGKHSEYTRNKISNALKGERNPRYGEKYPGQMRNRSVTKCERLRRSLAHKNQIPVNKKGVLQYANDGLVITRFESMLEASKLTGVPVSNICRCANGKRKTAGGYMWKCV